MNKKLIISKTVLFIFIISFIIGFQKIFGVENTLVGVTVITAALMLLGEDLTISPFKYFTIFMVVNLFLGISSFVAGLNLWIGIPVNFIVMFLIGFLFCYDFKINLYIPFGLQYLFMLSVPVNQNQILYRLISLIFGAMFIVLVQLICNKNRLTKNCNKITSELIQKTLNKVQQVKNNNLEKNLDENIEKDIKKINKLVYSKKKDGFYLTECGRINLNMAFILRSINLYLNDFYNCNDRSSLDKIYEIIMNMYKSKENFQWLSKIKYTIQEELKTIDIKNQCTLRMILINLDILCGYFIKLYNLESDNYINKNQNLPDEFSVINVLKKNLNSSSLRFSYALRMAMCTTLAIFIMDYFKIYEARWMAYTVFAIVQPCSEHSKTKSLQRLKGTLIGAIIFVILFTIFKNSLIRSIIVIGAGYIDGYNTTYDRKMICVTISALGVAVITSNMGIALLYRILFVVLGIITALLANKFILPYTLKDSSKDLINMSDSIINKLLEEVKLHISKGSNNHTIENLFMIYLLIEDKFRLNKLNNYIKRYEENSRNRKKLMTSIYEVYILAENNKNVDNKFKEILSNIGRNKELSY